MSYNLVDPTTGDLTRVAGRNAIDDGSVSNSKVWSSRKVSDELNKKVSSTEVAHIKRFDSVPGNDWNNAIEEGYYSIPIDMVANTIANRPFDFAIQIRVIKSDTNDPNYVYQIAYVSSQDSRIYIRKLDGNGTWTAWQELATMDKVPESVINPTELDTNKFLKSGYYSLGDASNRTNLPAYEACTLLVFNAGWYIIQEILTNVSNGMYYRKSLDNGSTWNAWTKVSTT